MTRAGLWCFGEAQKTGVSLRSRRRGCRGGLEFLERQESCVAFRCLLAATHALSQLHASVQHGTPEGPVMIWPLGIKQLVAGNLRRAGLQVFLKVTFGIFEVGQFYHLGSSLSKEVHQPLASGLEPSVHKHRADDRLEGIGQGRAAGPATAGIFTTAENDVLPQLKTPRLPGQRRSIHQLSPRLGQSPLTQPRKPLVKLRSNGQLDHRIPQELQPLIVVLPPTFFMRHGRMRQSQGQERWIAKTVPQSDLEIFESGHGIRWMHCRRKRKRAVSKDSERCQ